jgi:hypothetical protein
VEVLEVPKIFDNKGKVDGFMLFDIVEGDDNDDKQLKK